MMRLELGAEAPRVLGRVPGPDVFPVPHESDRFLLVEDRFGGEDFAQDPVLSLIDASGDTLASFGPGLAPLVAPDGSKVAFLRSAADQECEGEVCLVSVELLVSPLDGEPRVALPAGDWHPLSWAGNELILSAQGETLRLKPDGTTEKLAVSPDEVWGVTPDGTEMVISRRRGVEIMDMETLERRPTDVDGLLAEGEWSPNGQELIAVVVDGGSTRLIRLSLSDGTVEEIPDSEGASGPVLWGPAGTFAYVRAAGLKLEAVSCTQAADCTSVLTWAEGITPLALD